MSEPMSFRDKPEYKRCLELSKARQADLCAECGKRRDDSKHVQYGPDLDNPVKHEFVERESEPK